MAQAAMNASDRARHSVFAPVSVAIGLVVVGAYLTIVASSAADGFLPQVNARTPLATVQPVLAAAPQRLSRRVVLVICDGLRLRDSYGQATLDALRARGIDAWATSHYPTLSRPNYVSLVTGVPPTASGVRNNAFNSPVALDSIMDRVAAAGLSSGYVGDYATALAVMFTDDFAELYYTQWRGGMVKASKRIVSEQLEFIVLVPGTIDEVGHRFGGDSPEYRAAVATVDSQIAPVVDALDLARDTIIVTADHGHVDRGGHGGTETDVMEVPLIMAGAGIRPRAALAPAQLVDVPATVATLLGVPPPGHGLGRVLTEALMVDPETAARIANSDRARQLRNEAITQAWVDAARSDVSSTRVRRLLLSGFLALLAIAVVVVLRRMRVVMFDWRVLLIAVPAFPVTYYAFLHVLGHDYSLSAIPERGSAMRSLFRFGLLSTATHVVAAWFALRGRIVLRDRLAAANALTLCGVFVAWLPAAFVWAIFSAGPFARVPSSAVMVLVPATYVAVACYALAAAVILGLEIIVFFARAIDPRIRLRRLERAAARERERLEHEPW